MTNKLEIRPSRPSDLAGIEQLYKDTFPEEGLLPLVEKLHGFGPNVISLIGINGKEIAGHICFTFCNIEGKKLKVALLGPLAVIPTLHRQGVGSKLVHQGLKLLGDSNIAYVFVLGDPAYYGRFGFKTEDKVLTPYPLTVEWHEAWQSIRLCDTEAPVEGKLSVPEPWHQIALWTS